MAIGLRRAEKKGVKVAYADPKEGRISWVGVYGILKGTKNKELALKFLDEKLSTRTANNVVNELGYGVANQEVWSRNSNPTLKELSLDDPSVLQRTNFRRSLPRSRLTRGLTCGVRLEPSRAKP